MKLKRRVRRKPYWLLEPAQEAVCGVLVLRWFPRAGKLQLHRQLPGQQPRYQATFEVDTLALAPKAQDLLGHLLEEAARLKLWA